MRKMLLATATVAALTMALALAAVALAGTATKVTIEAQQGGFFGFVHSSKQDPCELNRKVKLYKQKGSEQKPHTDRLIGTDIAQPNGPDSQWSINTDKSGKFYARTPAKGICDRGASKTIHSQ